jgi:signal transduction histidine kinase
MTPHEIRPKQLRALLLLLVLVPLIPTALMMRFMFDTLRFERAAALDRAAELHGSSLSAMLKTLRPAPDEAMASRAARAVAGFVTQRDVTVRVLDKAGTHIAGEASPWGAPLAQALLPGQPDLTLQLHLAGPQILDAAIGEQRAYLLTIGVVTALAVLIIAGTAALAVHRQIALSELKNTSVATVAHELRTPLASIRMLVDTLREGRYRGDSQLREYLGLVAAENERLTRLAENFLTFSRLERNHAALPLEAVAVRDVVEQAAAPLSPRLNAPGCAFTLDVPAGIPAVRADRDALAQVLSNLLDNALKYTDAEKRITLRVRAENSHIQFAIEDNGIGLTPADADEIFHPFHQLDRKLTRTRGGCGLGLAIVRRIVDAHGGKITVTAAPTRGSIFTITIPAA